MSKAELIAEIEEVLGSATYVYDGEIYAEDLKKSIGYLPDLASDVADYLGWDNDEWSVLSDYIQIDLYDKCVEQLYKGNNEQLYKDYFKVVRNFLAYLIS